MSTPTPLGFLAEQLADVEIGWSIGSFGAIAEFTRDVDEAVALIVHGCDFCGDAARRIAHRGKQRHASNCVRVADRAKLESARGAVPS